MNKIYIVNVVPLLNKEVYGYYYDRIGTERQKKADRLVSWEDKARSVGAGAVLRFAIEDCTPYNYDKLVFFADENGKPRVEGDCFYFSLSHSGDYAVCVISDSPVGIDIEKERVLSDRFKKRFAQSITDWTKREAKGKLTGKGVFDSTEGKFVYTTKKTDGYVITVCSDKEINELRYYHLPYPC